MVSIVLHEQNINCNQTGDMYSCFLDAACMHVAMFVEKEHNRSKLNIL